VLRERHQLFKSVLVASDAAVIAASIVLAYWIRFILFPPEQGVTYTFEARAIPWIVVPAMMTALWWAGIYQPRRDQRFDREAAIVIRAMALGMLVAVALVYLLKDRTLGPKVDPSRLQLGIFGTLSTIGLLMWRMVFRWVLRSLRRRGWNLRHVAIIGTGRLGQVVFHTLQRNSWTGITPAYFVSHLDEERRESVCGAPIRGTWREIDRLLDAHEVAGVFVALPNRMAAELPKLLARLERHPIDVRIVPDVNPRYTPFSMATSELEGMPLLSLRQSPLGGAAWIWKRTIDVVGSIVAIIVFAPVMLLIAVLVRLAGPGPVIFRQPRASLGGRTFMLYKFRTMSHVGHEQLAMRDQGRGTDAWTDANDPRITRIGRLLRRTSLDELPQLFNVLLGEMSLVGPRPERPELISRFREDWRGYMLRQHVKAGMTGWAQVNGLRGRSSLRKRLQYDLFYIRHWSLAFDLRILWLTLFRGFVHPNAQ
jgi:Undecaprenyl-phosphate glucose phosphotransferase